MRYIKYFSDILKHQGVPNLNVEQYARLMNIVSLEGILQELLVKYLNFIFFLSSLPFKFNYDNLFI